MLNMEPLKVIVYCVAFASELTSAVLIAVEIRENHRTITEKSSNPTPISDIADQDSGPMNRWTRDKARKHEMNASERQIAKLKSAECRLAFAFLALVNGAIAALVGNLL